MLSAEENVVNGVELTPVDTDAQSLKEQKNAAKIKRPKRHDELQYLELIQHIMDHGVVKSDRTGSYTETRLYTCAS